MKILIHNNAGGKVAVGIEGTREEQEQVFNRFYNYGGANGRLHEMQPQTKDAPGFAFFFGYENELVKALETHLIVTRRFTPVDKTYKAQLGAKNGKKKGCGKKFLSMISAAAESEFDSYPRENFLGNESTPIIFRELDGGAPFEVAEYEE